MDLPLTNQLIHFNRDDFQSRFDVVKHGVTEASGDKYMEMFQYYFGAPPHPERLVNDMTWHDHFQTPWAYQGKNVLIKERMLGLINDNMTWLQQEPDGFPMEYAPYSTYTWTTFKFEEGLLDIIPEEGPGYVLRSASSQASGTLYRKGKAIYLEHGFFLEPEGRTHYYRQLIQMANTINLTIAFDTIQAMLTTRPDTVAYLRDMGYMNKPYKDQVVDVFQQFGMFQKSAYAPETFVARMKAMFSARNVVPGAIITPHGNEYFFRGTGSEKLDYDKVGPSGPALRAVDPTNVRTFEGLRLRYTRPFLMNREGQLPLELLIRRRLVGEYYKMFAMPAECYNKPGYEYRSSHRDIFIFDLAADNWARISLRQAVEHLNCFIPGVEEFEPAAGAAPGVYSEFLRPNVDGVNINYGPLISNNNVDNEDFLKGTLGEISAYYLPQSIRDLIRKTREKAVNPIIGGGRGRPQAAADVILGDLHPLPMEVAEKVSISGNLSGQKRSLDENKIGVSGYFTISQSDKSSLAPVDYDAENRRLMNAHSVSADTQAHYDKFLSLGDINKEGFLKKTNETLSSGDASVIQSNFATPLQKIIEKQTRSAVDATKTVAALSTPSSPIQASSIASALKLSPGKYDLSEVETVNGKNGVEFHYLDSKTGEEVTALTRALIMPEQVGAKLSASFTPAAELKNVSPDYMNAPLTRGLLLSMVDNDVFFPFNILIFRPVIALITNSLIVLKGGRETGKNLYRNPDTMVGDDDVIKAHRVFFTVDTTTVVLEPLNIHVQDDVSIREYVSGYTAKPFSSEDVTEFIDNGFVPNLTDPDRPSWFSYLIPITNNRIPDVIDVCGRFTTGRGGEQKEELQFLTTPRDRLYAAYVKKHRANTSPYDWSDREFNRICGQGSQKCWSMKDGAHTAMILGVNAPLGVNVYPGMRRVIKGLDTVFEQQGYEKCEQYQYM